MRFCQPHWDALRDAIRERGLYDLVPKSGETAARAFAAEVEQGVTLANYDPLMRAHMAILAHSMEAVGLAIMAPNEDGTERCPLCFLNKSHADGCPGPPGCDLPRENAFDSWIARAADDESATYQRLLREAGKPPA